jgi:hypothetical protein
MIRSMTTGFALCQQGADDAFANKPISAIRDPAGRTITAKPPQAQRGR